MKGVRIKNRRQDVKKFRRTAQKTKKLNRFSARGGVQL